VTNGKKIQPGPFLADAVEVIWHKTTIHMYGVSDSQLEELTAGYNSLYFVLFGICTSAAVSLGIAFAQTSEASDKPYYLAGTLATLGIAAVAGVTGFMRYGAASARKKKLYRESVPIERR